MSFTQTYVEKYIYEKGDELLSSYKNSQSLVEIKCGVCKQVSSKTFSSYKQGIGCKYCKGNVKHTIEFVRDKIKEGGDLLISSEYKNARTPLEVQCSKCKNIYNIRYDDYRRGKRCGNCNGKHKLSYDDVKKRIEEGGNTLVSTTYINYHSKLTIRCSSCSKNYSINLANYSYGYRCNYCAIIKNTELKKHSYEYVFNYVQENGELLKSETYVNSLTKLDIQCHKCKTIYKLCFSHFKKGVRCSKCNMSRGENEIFRILKKYKLQFETQKRFKNCFNKKTLPFDFYIDDVFQLCIEYNGIQHYKAVPRFGGEIALERVKKSDSIKKKFCEENNIPFLIIPYWDQKNIENILEKYVEDHAYFYV